MERAGRRATTGIVQKGVGLVVALLGLAIALPAAASATTTQVWPNDSTTGVPAGTRLRVNGQLRITVDGTVIDRLDIRGCVLVEADDVVIRRSRIRCGGSDLSPYPIRQRGRNLTVEDVEIDGLGTATVAVCCSSYTLRRVDIHDVVDGPRLASATVVEDSWIHGLRRSGDAHGDALQTTGGVGIVVRGNRLEAFNPETGDRHNAGLMIGSTTAPEVRDLVVEGNVLDGGNFTINIRRDAHLAGVVIRDNQFGPNCRYGALTGDAGRPQQDLIVEDNGWTTAVDAQGATAGERPSGCR